jgi:hypothetical protein
VTREEAEKFMKVWGDWSSWADIRDGVIAVHDRAWQAASADSADQIRKLREALTRICTQFPTDTDMAAAGWETHEINAACDAYDAARAALKETE